LFTARLKDVATDTNVNSDLIKGVSGGERKLVGTAEAMLSGSALQCWDNSTFCTMLKATAELAGGCTSIAH